jgi:AcrR family transcriptional regulator
VSGRRQRRKARTRTILSEAALDLVSQRGIYDTRVEDITEAADLGKGAFYNYFESKETLIGQLMSEGVDLLDREYLATGVGETPEARIVAIVRSHVAFFRDHPPYLLLFHQVRGLLQIRRRRSQILTDSFGSYLRRLGGRLLPPAGSAWDDATRLDHAALLAGAIMGYLSFCHAAGLEFREESLERLLECGAAPVGTVTSASSDS